MRKVALYFNDVYLDLFGDEDIVLTRKATDYRELGRVYTDFTQTFTVPATPKNNKALKHYYDMTVLNGYAQSESIPGRIEVDTLPVRSGLFIIEGAKLTNGLPSSYSLVFYGDLKSLKDTFGEDKLEDLDLSSYDHAHSFANVETGVEGAGLKSGEIYYPLISPVRKWFYNSASSNHDENNIAYHSGHSSNDHGIRHYELKPALKVAPIIDAIESKYGITFNSSFFASSAFTDLYLWLHRNEGYMPSITQPITVSVTQDTPAVDTLDNTAKTPTITFLLYNFDASDSVSSVDLDGRRILKTKTQHKNNNNKDQQHENQGIQHRSPPSEGFFLSGGFGPLFLCFRNFVYLSRIGLGF